MTDITRIGREHLARYGAAGLSLRAVARDLGVVSSAIYRYVASRDDLLTLLLVDAYGELGDAVDAALDHAGEDLGALGARWRSLAHAVRDWALANPAPYGLLYGSPVPGYAAPAEQTTGPGTRVVTRIVEIAAAADLLEGRRRPPAPPSLDETAARITAELGAAITGAALAGAVQAWSALVGAVSLEVFGQYGDGTVSDPDELFATVVGRLEPVLLGAA